MEGPAHNPRIRDKSANVLYPRLPAMIMTAAPHSTPVYAPIVIKYFLSFFIALP